jgi:hypothetical protein
MRGLACHICCQMRGGLLLHLFTRSLRLETGFFRNRLLAQGGLFSVPLSVGSPRPGVTRRIALWSSDFPLPSRRGSPSPRRGARAKADSSDCPAHCGKFLNPSFLRRASKNLPSQILDGILSHLFPAKSDTARVSCTDCCAAYRSPRPSSRCSIHSLSTWRPDTRALSRT